MVLLKGIVISSHLVRILQIGNKKKKRFGLVSMVVRGLFRFSRITKTQRETHLAVCIKLSNLKGL